MSASADQLFRGAVPSGAGQIPCSSSATQATWMDPATALARGVLNLVGGAFMPPFLNGWGNFGSGFASAAFWKDALGIVHLEGLIKGGTVSLTTTGNAFQLSAAYWPVGTIIVPVMSNDTLGQIRIDTSGFVNIRPPSNNTWVSLDGIAFRTS